MNKGFKSLKRMYCMILLFLKIYHINIASEVLSLKSKFDWYMDFGTLNCIESYCMIKLCLMLSFINLGIWIVSLNHYLKTKFIHILL